MSFQQCGKCNEIYDNVVPHSCKVDPAIAARDKEWVEWGESKCPHESVDDFRKGSCELCWQERKRGIGL